MPVPGDKEISRYLSLVLRHDPDAGGVTLDPGGWAELEAVLGGAPWPLAAEDIVRVVAGSDKKRFALSGDGRRIRAQQGHSVPVDLALEPVTAPRELFHGTSTKALDAILVEGFRPMKRHHVHLSPDVETETRVGARHGTPVVLRVDAAALAQTGHMFFRSENGVWLTDHVPAEAMEPMSDP
ncbi:MAG: RNA 2'-phosphotransferase [Pseudomonadota bacterium]